MQAPVAVGNVNSDPFKPILCGCSCWDGGPCWAVALVGAWEFGNSGLFTCLFWNRLGERFHLRFGLLCPFFEVPTTPANPRTRLTHLTEIPLFIGS
jgi:hypothetical protein